MRVPKPPLSVRKAEVAVLPTCRSRLREAVVLGVEVGVGEGVGVGVGAGVGVALAREMAWLFPYYRNVTFASLDAGRSASSMNCR